MTNTSNLETILRSIREDSGEFSILRYSGRSMFGRQCLAITADDIGKVFGIMVAAGQAANSEGLDIADEVIGARWDSMGRGTVVYWPSIPLTGEEISANPADDD